MEELFLLLRQKPMVRSLEILERSWIFSLLFSSFLFPSSFSPNFLSPYRIFWSNKSSGVSSLTTCHPLIGFLRFPLSSYPNLWIFTLSSCDTCPHGSHLDLCLTCSSFDTWIHMSYPTCAKRQLVTLGTSKNVKFRLSWNLINFDRVTRFCEMIPMMKSVSSSKIHKNSGFSNEITILPFFKKIKFSLVLHTPFSIYLFYATGQSVEHILLNRSIV